jgi:hypothetical protein
MSNNLESIGIANPPVGDQVFHPAPVPGGANDSGRTSIEARSEDNEAHGRPVTPCPLFSVQMDD